MRLILFPATRSPLTGLALAAFILVLTVGGPARLAAEDASASPKTEGTAAAPSAPGAPDAAPTSDKQPMRIYYLGKQYQEPLPLSYAEKHITDKGIQGARLSLQDANQAGNFLGYSFELEERIVPEEDDIVEAAKAIFKENGKFIVADLSAEDLLAVADLPEAKNALIMNIRSSATKLRQEECRANVFHIIPDYAMRADALAQYLIWKKWPSWYVLRRDTPEDQDYAAQVQRSAARYGGKVVEDQVYRLPPGARNLDSGHQQIQAQIPMETEQAPDHDVVWVINSEDDFGDYLMYRTSTPRPIVGTQGLQATAWDKSYTESGGMRFQRAMPRLANRSPVERDYTAWLGLRSLSSAAMKSGKTKPKDIRKFLLSDDFKLEAYKGQALSFRDWDQQMRQPIVLGGGTRVPVSTSPQDGFLHPTNLTDTLGFDKPETECELK